MRALWQTIGLSAAARPRRPVVPVGKRPLSSQALRGCFALRSNYSGRSGSTVAPIRQRVVKGLTNGNPCRQPGKRHARTCPPPCEPGCVRHAIKCPKRHGGGLVEVDVKSRAGKRAIGIPGPLLKALREHRAAQEKERETAGSLWEKGDWVFTQPNGRPIDRGSDQRAWKALLRAAGVREAHQLAVAAQAALAA